MEEKAALLRAFKAAGVIAEGHGGAHASELAHDVLIAAHRFIARTPCLLAGVRLADLVGPAALTNLPGTVDDYPNWQLRAPVDLGQIAEHPVFRAVTGAMAKERPRR